MAFHNVSLPDAFQYGSTFGFGLATIVQGTASGHEYRIARQAQARHRYRPLKQLQTTEEAAELKEFILGRRGALHSFRIKDWNDYSSNADGKTAPTMIDQAIATGDGSTTTFQLTKTYDADSAAPLTRIITLPVSGSVLVAVDGSLATVTVNTGGTVTFSAAPSNGADITAGFKFDVPVRFAESVDTYAGMRADAYGSWSMDALECIEVLNETEWPETWFAGGAPPDPIGGSTDVSLSAADGKLQLFNQTASINAYLPAPDYYPGGADIFVVAVLPTATGTVQLRDDTGAAVGTAIAAGSTKRVGLIVSGGAATWVVY